jgi:deoxycytidylate deaminase
MSKPISTVLETLYPQGENIVIALTYPVGAAADKVEKYLKNEIEKKNYNVHTIRISERIESGQYGQIPKREKTLQDKGNYLRQKHKLNYYLALKVIEEIKAKRGTQKKQAFIIRSLKTPEEVELLRAVYGSGFFLIGINTPIHERLKNLQLDGEDKNGIQDSIHRDENEDHDYGQRLSETYELSDFFIDTEYKKNYPIENQVTRFVRIIFGNLFVTPTPAEHAMFMAYGASYRSADMARQVGACITNTNHDIIALGTNEVPVYGGGCYWPDPSMGEPTELDIRDWSKGFDPNDNEKGSISRDLSQRLIVLLKDLEKNDLLEGDLFSSISTDKLETLFSKFFIRSIRHLTEFGRTVHAEMSALMFCATNGIATRGATLYATTFPCHNCARHIIASGIRKVVYIEPYLKSKATDLHSDSIYYTHMSTGEQATENADKNDNKLKVVPFFGMGPRRYGEFFAMRMQTGKRLERKIDGTPVAYDDDNLKSLRVPLTPNDYKARETLALSQLPKTRK